MKAEYIYLGDKFTDSLIRGRLCNAVRRGDGKCIRGKNRFRQYWRKRLKIQEIKNGNMFVEFDEVKHNVIGR